MKDKRSNGSIASRIQTNKGLSLISLLILIVIAILVLSYFGIDIKNLFESPTAQSNFSYVGNNVSYVWNNYLGAPLTYIWNVLVVDVAWKALIQPGLQHLQNAAANQPSINSVQNFSSMIPTK